ncbi:MAG: DUF6575 domain-containing protein [bacterium]
MDNSINSIKYKDTLLFYDTPIVFIGVDLINTNYVCQLIERDDKGDNYLCVQISPTRLVELIKGGLDLRNVFEVPELNQYYKITVVEDLNSSFELIPIDPKEIREDWLPKTGLFLEPVSENKEELILNEVKSRNSAIVHLILNPPESAVGHVISVTHLAGALDLFQLMLRHAFKKVYTGFGKDFRKLSDFLDKYSLEVFALSPGSFKIHLQSKEKADISGYVEISKGLEKIDEITGSIGDMNKSLEVLKANKGHLASSYINLLEFVIENDCPISYSWITPEREKPITKNISKKQAMPLYNEIAEYKELKVELLEIVGKIIRSDVKKGTWTIETDEGKEYSGKIEEGENISLKGTVNDSEKYRFYCEEKIIERVGAAKETKEYLLTKIEHIFASPDLLNTCESLSDTAIK